MLGLVAAAAARQVVLVLGNHEHLPKTAMGLDVMHTTMEETPRLRSGQPSIHQSRDGQRLAVVRGDCLGHGSGHWRRLDHWSDQALVKLERWSRRLGLPRPTVVVQQGRRGEQPPGCGRLGPAPYGFGRVICGHIHSACLKDHGLVRVLNTGCWTHSPGAFLESQWPSATPGQPGPLPGSTGGGGVSPQAS